MENQFEIKLFVLIGTLVVLLLIILIILFVVIQSKKVLLREQHFKNEILNKDTDALRNLIDSIENEKNRISKDLHDDVGPVLSVLRLKIGDVNSVDSQKELIDSLMNKIRSACQDLTPNFVLKFGLSNSLEQFNNLLPKEYKIQLLGLTSIDFSIESQNWQVSMYRILTELVNNSIKHSTCRDLKMKFDIVNEHYTIDYEYVGNGLNNDQFLKFSQSNRSLGLKSISDRIVLLKGEIEFELIGEISMTTIKIPVNEIED
jgi:two-component system NarL family sensor kinase